MAGNVIRGSEGKKRVISVKAGGGVSLGGMKPDLDPSSLPAQDFIDLVNVRRVGGLVVSRGGQAEFADLEGEATGMVDFQTGGGSQRLFLISNGADLYSYNPSMNPVSQLISPSPWDGNTSLFFLGQANIESSGDLPGLSGYFTMGYAAGEPPKLYRIQMAELRSGISSSELLGAPLTPVLTVPLVGGIPYSQSHANVVQSGNRLFFVAADLAGDAAIFSFDSLSVTRELAIVAGGAPLFVSGIQFRDTIVFFRVDTGSSLYCFIRSEAGTWTTVGPTGTLWNNGLYLVPASYQDDLYIALNDRRIYSFDGSAITTLAPATTGVDDSALTYLMSVVSLGGYLYYLWVNGDAPLKVRIGRFDGTTWNASYKTLDSDYTAVTNASHHMVAFQGSLYVTGMVGGTVAAFNKSPGSDVAGAWTIVPFGDGFAGAPTFVMVR